MENKDIMFSLAPMEGITTFVYRKVYREHFGGTGRYYTPFISANETHKIRKREKAEVQPFDEDLVPQLLANDPEEFIFAAKKLAQMGYREINLNMGCPSGTVVAKKKGSGMLSDLSVLGSFFEKIFAEDNMPLISAKTRIGIEDVKEAAPLAALIAKYPFSDVIIHPRTGREFYKGPIHMDAFIEMAEVIGYDRVTYNGGICTVSDFLKLKEELEPCRSFMIGRGLLSDPSLVRRIRGGERFTNRELKAFLDDLWKACLEWNPNEGQCLDKMKELWAYLGQSFPDKKRALKELKKARSKAVYNALIYEILG